MQGVASQFQFDQALLFVE